MGMAVSVLPSSDHTTGIAAPSLHRHYFDCAEVIERQMLVEAAAADDLAVLTTGRGNRGAAEEGMRKGAGSDGRQGRRRRVVW